MFFKNFRNADIRTEKKVHLEQFIFYFFLFTNPIIETDSETSPELRSCYVMLQKQEKKSLLCLPIQQLFHQITFHP